MHLVPRLPPPPWVIGVIGVDFVVVGAVASSSSAPCCRAAPPALPKVRMRAFAKQPQTIHHKRRKITHHQAYIRSTRKHSVLDRKHTWPVQ